ncbi:zinc finger BED domain-containing protein 6-like [Ostrinia nubilalis]|uniref:zinc finger BED domain-containing protein 6-like n=1 Tax=Ostrinia nubilalis TaxID=29057 RepID=UPI00308264F4
MPRMKSMIWTFFKRDEHDRDKSTCQICNNSYSRKGRTTSSLKRHLKSMHPEQFIVLQSLMHKKLLKINDGAAQNRTQDDDDDDEDLDYDGSNVAGSMETNADNNRTLYLEIEGGKVHNPQSSTADDPKEEKKTDRRKLTQAITRYYELKAQKVELEIQLLKRKVENPD